MTKYSCSMPYIIPAFGLRLGGVINVIRAISRRKNKQKPYIILNHIKEIYFVAISCCWLLAVHHKIHTLVLNKKSYFFMQISIIKGNSQLLYKMHR